MANFDTQIQALAGSATQSEMDEWMGEGVKEITNVLPAKLKLKCAQMTQLTSSTEMDLDGIGEILFVTRENANSGYHTSCREISPQHGHLASDSDNLVYYATATDPVYWIGGSNLGVVTDTSSLNVIPAPSGSQPANIHHISYTTVDASSVSVIANFPDEAEYLVVLYAAIKVLHNKMNEKSSDLPSLALPASPSPPSSPSFTTPDVSSITLTNVGVPPVYTSPTITASSTKLTEMEAISGGQIGTDADFIDFEMWFAALGEMIEDDEDIELAGAQIEKINAYVNTYNIQMQDNLNTFNEAATNYQGKLTEATQQAQINAQEAQTEANLKLQKETQEYSASLNLFQAEVQKYSSEVNSKVQDFTLNLQKHTTDYNWLQGQYSMLKADYQKGLQMLIGGGLPQPQATQQQRGR